MMSEFEDLVLEYEGGFPGSGPNWAAYEKMKARGRYLEEENARLREAARWIPVEERLPEDTLGGASAHVEVAYAVFNEETGEIGNYYLRGETQYWHKYGCWGYEYKDKVVHFEEWGYKVLFWRNITPLPSLEVKQ